MRRMGTLTRQVLEGRMKDRPETQIQRYLTNYDLYDLDTDELRIYSIKYLQDNNIEYEVLREV
jgi:hypothetical protein